MEVGHVVLLDDGQRRSGLEAGGAQIGHVARIPLEHAHAQLLELRPEARLHVVRQHYGSLAERGQLLGQPHRDPVRPRDDERLHHGSGSPRRASLLPDVGTGAYRTVRGL
jgi:hypothetical protein